MSKQEISRSHQLAISALTPPIGLGPEVAALAVGAFNDRTCRTYDLLLEEEALVSRIQDNGQRFSRAEIEHLVALVTSLSKEGYPTILVDADEMLDIAQTFSAGDAYVTAIIEKIGRLQDISARKFTQAEAIARIKASSEAKEFQAELPQQPSPETAEKILQGIIASLSEKDNSSWTARVVAALAYFSSISEAASV